MRVKASAVGLDAEEYRAELAVDSGWTGMAELDVTAERDATRCTTTGRSSTAAAAELPCHTGLVLLSAAGQRRSAGSAPTSRSGWCAATATRSGCTAASAEQRIALDLLLDPDVGHRVSLGGRAGTGKSALALCAGLEAVHGAPPAPQGRGVPAAVRGRRPGARLPARQRGREDGPLGQAVFDTLGALVSREVVEEILDRGMLEVLPLTHIRGRSLHDAFVIVDEAQSLERNVLLTVLSRIGQNSKVVLTHDVAQRDNLRVGRHDGVVAVIEALKGHPLFAHVTLTRSRAQPDRGAGHRAAGGPRAVARRPGRPGPARRGPRRAVLAGAGRP